MILRRESFRNDDDDDARGPIGSDADDNLSDASIFHEVIDAA
jgi:hypothetical protein